MPVNTDIAQKIWTRYAWCRDNGHAKYVEKAERCDRFFAGDQWEEADKSRLALVRRPALTINKILPTVANIMGEQINARAETSFRPRSGASSATADTLNKVFKQISDNNQLAWKRSDMFADGIITSRGFLDVRIEYGDSMTGEVRIDNLNPKNVIIDPDGEDYDPDTWSEAFTTKWLTADDIAVLYSAEDAELLRNREQSYFPYGYDSIQAFRDRFGDRFNPMYTGDYDNSNVMRNIRVIDRQYRKLDRQKHFVSTETGQMRPVPESFNRDKIAFFVDKFGFQIAEKMVRRIRWTVIADNVLLHDDWSPYKHYTVVPYFPHFRRGNTIGLVENLLDSQDLLNKTTSQELHVVNTTANSGYKVKAGALANMSVEELEQNGARTGLVIEVNGDPDKDVQKIAPNQVPQGLDRISYKAEEHIKTVSGVSDSAQGMDRADVAAKAIQEKRKAGSTNLVKPLDNLTRTDYFLARNTLDLVQEFYTSEQIMTIVKDETTGETEDFVINQVQANGEVLNDLTLGEYDVVITSVPARESLEDSQFEQAMAMREAGITLPDDVLIDTSRLMNKKDIIRKMAAQSQSPEAQARRQLEQAQLEAEVTKTQGEGAVKQADAGLKQAKTQETMAKTQVLAETPPEPPKAGPDPELEHAVASHEASLKERDQAHKEQMALRDFNLKKEKQDMDAQLKAADMAANRETQRVEQEQQAAAAALKPQGAAK